MRRYLLSICQCDGPPPADLDMDAVMSSLDALNKEMTDAGVFVLTDACMPPETASVVQPDGSTSEGSFWKGDVHVGGFWIIQVADDAAAREWGSKAAQCLHMPIEVRGLATPVQA